MTPSKSSARSFTSFQTSASLARVCPGYAASVPASETRVWRHILPWLISAAALVYVFGYAVDWESIPRATEDANLPLFVAITVADKLAFFLVWAFIQTRAIREFVEPISMRALLSVKGAAELLRTGSNLLSDGAFLLGVSQLVRNRLAAVMAVIVIPFSSHFFVLLCQATLVLPLLVMQSGLPANLDVAIGAAIGWTTVAAWALAVRLGYWRRMLERAGLGDWVKRSSLRRLAPILGWFALFAIFDALIQGFASRAFGVEIPWSSLFARIPLLYVAISLPSFGNFGVREIAWSTLFAEYGSREALIAFALWTNAIFAVMHVLIGVLFVGRAITLVQDLRQAHREGKIVPAPILHDAIDR